MMPHFGRFDMVTPRTAAPVAVTLTGSPATFTAPSNGLLVVTGGAVSVLQYKAGAAVVALGLTSGLIPINKGDSVTITYLVTPPTVTFIASAPQ